MVENKEYHRTILGVKPANDYATSYFLIVSTVLI